MRFAGSQLSNFISGTNFDNIGKAGITSRANENNARRVSDAYVDMADINADATVQSAKYGASATRAQGAAAGQSAMFSGLGSMASGIAGGFASKGEGISDTGRYTNNPLGTISDPTADIQRALGTGVKFGMY